MGLLSDHRVVVTGVGDIRGVVAATIVEHGAEVEVWDSNEDAPESGVIETSRSSCSARSPHRGWGDELLAHHREQAAMERGCPALAVVGRAGLEVS